MCHCADSSVLLKLHNMCTLHPHVGKVVQLQMLSFGSFAAVHVCVFAEVESRGGKLVNFMHSATQSCNVYASVSSVVP